MDLRTENRAKLARSRTPKKSGGKIDALTCAENDSAEAEVVACSRMTFGFAGSRG